MSNLPEHELPHGDQTLFPAINSVIEVMAYEDPFLTLKDDKLAERSVIHEVPGGFNEALTSAQIAADGLNAFIGLKVPSIAGGNLQEEKRSRLSKAFELLRYFDLQPEVVITREGLDLSKWGDIFYKLSQKINAPVAVSGDFGPLTSPSIKTNWEELALTTKPVWTVGIIAAAAKPPICNLSHSLKRLDTLLGQEEITTVRNSFPTTAEYLTLQALRYLARREPVDVHGSTWLRGTIESKSKAPIGEAIKEVDTAAISCAPPIARAPNIGIRLTEREIIQIS